MIADVRLKVKMRLEARMSELLEEARGSWALAQDSEWKAEHSGECADIRKHYLDEMRKVVPGCAVSRYLYKLYVYLPVGYPKPTIPIVITVPRDVLRAMEFGRVDRQ